MLNSCLKKAWCLDIGRFLVGVAIGILTYVVATQASISPIIDQNVFVACYRVCFCFFLAVAVVVTGTCIYFRNYS